jgi:hypothetical protein
VTVLGAVTDDGDSFYCWTEENLTRFHGTRLLEALKERFGDELVVFLDRAGSFLTRGLVALRMWASHYRYFRSKCHPTI